MNDIFSFSRFGLLVKKFTREHFSGYLLYLAAMFGIMTLIYGLTTLGSLQGRFPADVSVVYFAGGIIFGSGLFASSFYAFFHNRAKGIQYLNLPSSLTEKLVLSFIFTQVIFFIGYIIVFFLVDHLMVAFYNHFHKIPSYVPAESYPQYKANPLDYGSNMVAGSVCIAFVTSSISHFGSLSFEKHAFVKTTLLTLLIGAGLLFYNFYSLRSMIREEVMPTGNFYNSSMRVGDHDSVRGVVLLPGSWTGFIEWFLPVMLYLLFWMSSYFKLKEKQV